jgi:hypothetical protein
VNSDLSNQRPRPASYTELVHRELFSDFEEPPLALIELRPRR